MGQSKRCNWRQLVTVEPVIFFYAFGLFMHMPVIQQYIYFRIAKSKGFPYSTKKSSSCGNVTMLNDTMKDLEKQVQSMSSYVHLGVVMFSAIPSLFVSLLIGSWTDSKGRKPALFFPALGSALEAGITILVMYFEWPIYVLFIGAAVNGICGYFTTMILGVMSYIADTTDEADRPLRLAVLELITFLGGMVSQVTSGIWIETQGFITPYWFILGCLLFSVLYTLFFVPESRPPSTVQEKTKFASCRSLKRIYTVYASAKDGNKRNLILLTLSSGIMQVALQGVTGVITLYVLHSPLCFSPEFVGYFTAWRSLSIGLGAIIGIRLLGRWFSELTISRLGILTRVASLVLLAFSTTKVLVFMAPLAGLLNGCVVPIFRAMMSRIVSSDEQGALFSAVASIEALSNFIGAFIFNTLYPFALNKLNFQGFPFLVGAFVALVPLCFMCCLKNPMSLLSKRDRVQIVGNYETMPEDNLSEPPIQGSVSSDDEVSSINSVRSRVQSANSYTNEPSRA